MSRDAYEAELPGLPRAALTAWFARELPQLDAGDAWRARVIAGGLSNITYRIEVPGGTVVLRRPPLAGVVPSAHDMIREHTVQSALAGAGGGVVPVPTPLALCADTGVLGAPFYVMADVAGTVLRGAEDTAALGEVQRAALAGSLVDALVALHSVDPDAVGLSGFGRPQGYTARQVRRWGEQWRRTATRDLPDMARLLAGLADRVPRHGDSAIVHGDYRLDNTIVDLSGDPPRIAAVLDWELSTLGDPLADLGMFLTYWYDSHLVEGAAFGQIAGLTAAPGFPDTDAVAQAYAVRSGRDVSELRFHRALGAMKLAVILEGVHARYLGGRTISAGYEGVEEAVPVLTARGLELLG
ncbi:phosphotransferase family protein [Micromonospora sp. NPDC047074]|uniref:phosphotransferase family protein n=1 Tax=Micromonospora sp. NPDC047074 TaxID=3154339 RepID=UPI0034056F69